MGDPEHLAADLRAFFASAPVSPSDPEILAEVERLKAGMRLRAAVLAAYRQALVDGGFSETHAYELVRVYETASLLPSGGGRT